MSDRTRAYLMTRGTMRNQGYAFLGSVPPDQWWEAVGQWVILESEELIVRRDTDGATGVLISGVPSQRTDVIGTRIRHTVVLDAPDREPRLALWLARCGLDDAERTKLGQAVDAVFDADRVSALMSDPDADIEEQLLGVLRQLADDTADRPAGGDVAGSWAGAVDDEEAVAAFLARVHGLVSGEAPGYAFTTHALGSVDGARRAVSALADSTAVLLHDSGLKGVERLDGASAVGKARGPATAGKGLGRNAKALAVAVLAVLALAFGVWWVTRRL